MEYTLEFRDKNNWGQLSLLLILSWGAPVKVRYQSLKYDCKCYIYPLLFLPNYNIAMLGVISPVYFCPL